ncbi:hypothetical protein ATN37_01650 [Rhodococcus sp. MH15]|nr:hypothetical protein XU06_31250 [Rhodococcus erythropolis]EQM29948.1 hypothetical protein N601_30240 [Rhodococcus erythropolis DN1]MBW0288717.1 hypothetical protein [Rhodococcus sp. MH15]
MEAGSGNSPSSSSVGEVSVHGAEGMRETALSKDIGFSFRLCVHGWSVRVPASDSDDTAASTSSSRLTDAMRPITTDPQTRAGDRSVAHGAPEVR